MIDKRDILQGNPLMVGLPAEALDALLAKCRLRRLVDGEYLYRQHEAGEAMYGVLEGRIRLSNSSRDGRELLVMLVERGDWIGEVSLFDGEPRSHDAYAVGDSLLLMISRADLDSLLEAQPQLYRYFLPMLCRKLRLALSYVEVAALYPLSARLALRLLDLQAHYSAGDGEVMVPQEDLAKMLAVSRQAVSRELKRLEKAGVIALAYGKVCVLDSDALRREAEGGAV
ncbi:Crp/Fnr family transcriptional regulator [Spongiibacter sp.]|uniref:Crp/Fnr family transcriptional regulator n=1 Tax=Spongiibacter sp. TaxID=2024860 RepID=UPI003564CF7C